MHSLRAVSLFTLLLAVGIGHAQAQKIVCWKDKAGKVVGCGDKVPPEFQDNATKELNKRGVVVNQSAPALTADQKRALQADLDRKAAEDQKAAEIRRKDRALLDTFSNDKEIDLKRNRDIQLIESNIEAQQTNLKNANDRQADARIRIDQLKKENKPIPAPLQEDYDRAEASKTKIQTQITQKRKEIADLNVLYDEMKKRFIELKGDAPANPPGSAAKPGSPPATATSAAAGKK
jgi:hypothetical protein